MRRINVRNYASSLGVSLPSPRYLRGHEDEVGERVFIPFIKALDYKDEDARRKPSLEHELLKGGKRRPDFGVFEYNSKKFGLVVSIKNYEATLTNRMEEELCGWCGLAGSLYGCLTNGTDLIVIKPARGVIKWDYINEIPRKSKLEDSLGKVSYSPYDRTYATRIIEELSPENIHTIADYCHGVIRRRKGMRIPDRLYEYSKLILMRIIDERRYRAGKQTELRMSSVFIQNLKERGVDIQKYIDDVFSSIRDEVGVFAEGEKVELKPGLVEEITEYLDAYPMWSEEIDVLGEIYERFLMKTMTGRELGDFFTPRLVIDAVVKMVDPQPGERMLDPACGTGGFLTSSMRHIINKYGVKKEEVVRNLYGIDIDEKIIKLCKVNLWLHGNSHKNIVRGNSLDPTDAPHFLKESIKDPKRRGFNVILTNPPFGRRGGNQIPKERVENLIKKWGFDIFECSAGGSRSIAPQSAFMELCIKSLRPGGRLGIIIDNGLLSNPSKEDPDLRNVIRRECIVDAVIGMPKGTFKPYGSNVYPDFLIMHRKCGEEEIQRGVFRGEARKVGLQPARNVYVEDSDEDLRNICEIWEKWSQSAHPEGSSLPQGG